jgi:hypothetical protein
MLTQIALRSVGQFKICGWVNYVCTYFYSVECLKELADFFAISTRTLCGPAACLTFGLMYVNKFGGVCSSLIFKHIIFVVGGCIVQRLSAEGTLGPTRKEDDALLLPVVEEIVKRPKTSVLVERIRGQVWRVGVDVAIRQVDFLVECSP